MEPPQSMESTTAANATHKSTLTPLAMGGREAGFGGNKVSDRPLVMSPVPVSPDSDHPVPPGSPSSEIVVDPKAPVRSSLPNLEFCTVRDGCGVGARFAAALAPAWSLHGQNAPVDPAGMSARISCCAAVSICAVSLLQQSAAVTCAYWYRFASSSTIFTSSVNPV